MEHWYYESGGAQQGPVDAGTLRDLIEQGLVGRSTLVWRAGMADWEPAGHQEGLFAGPPPMGHAPVHASAHPAAGGRRYVESHMAKAVLVTLFCCLPFGIAAIVNASKVSGAVAMGAYAEAEMYSKKANDWANLSIVLGLVFGVLYFLVAIAGAAL